MSIIRQRATNKADARLAFSNPMETVNSALKAFFRCRSLFIVCALGFVGLVPFTLPAQEDAAVVSPAEAAPIEKLRANVAERDKAMERMNLKFYASVELTAPRTATITVTDQWMQYVTADDNQGNINSLFDAWRFSHGSDATGVTLIVLAPDGEVIREVAN